MAILEMEGGGLQNEKLGSVKAAIASYGQHKLKPNSAIKKFQTDSPKELNNEVRGLRQAEKMVKDITQRTEDSNSREKVEIQNLENVSQFDKVMKELELVKQELSKLKLDIDLVLEEKRRATTEISTSVSKSVDYSSSVAALTKEIEEVNEEHVLVELARIEATKESREIEAKRIEQAAKHSIEAEEKRKGIQAKIHEIGNRKEMEANLAITVSDVNVLKSNLNQVDQSKSSVSLLESLTRELDATKKELASVEAERFEFMVSMDVIRNEITRVEKEADTYKEKAEMAIQSLNSKLNRAKAKVESSAAAAEKAKSTASNLSLTLQHIKSETESAEREESTISEETALIKKQIRKTEIRIESAEERLNAALQDLREAKSSESMALEKLESIIQRTVRNRASISECSSTIRIFKFEYDYLKGNAGGAIEIADKKVEAARAWVEALKASEREIQIRSDVWRRESREIRVERENESMGGKRAKVRKSTSSSTGGGGSRSASFSIRRRKYNT